ncbi:hypothetical protein ARMSODRAFT_50282 [Armillaria solidipes]|uniref:Uncharacterized protein n=1 Tax=Armillaria solidipes TaxID=1076256 RepID=A0A2H3CHL1_9AGAR|nr:hypothetical protein ARMSODRAFT_50282 [Armillaria solidipes]
MVGEPENRSDARSAGTASSDDKMFRGFLKLNARFVQPKICGTLQECQTAFKVIGLAKNDWLIEIVLLRRAGRAVLQERLRTLWRWDMRSCFRCTYWTTEKDG